MIEYLEADLIGELIDASNTPDVALAELANSDETITAEAKASNGMDIYLKEERRTESYKETMQIDIENINTIEKGHKVCKKL